MLEGVHLTSMPPVTPPLLSPTGWQLNQGTVAGEVVLSGRGLHTGRKVTARILPVTPGGTGAAGQGIIFRRVHSGRVVAEFPVSPGLWCKQPLCSTLRAANGAQVRTVEHFLAALMMCQIDHATVELDSEELPHLDGSARELVAALTARGRVALPLPKRFIRILRPVDIRLGDNVRYQAVPFHNYAIHASVKVRGFQRMVWQCHLTPETFAQDVAPARSYGHVKLALLAMAGGLLTRSPLLRGVRLGSVAAVFNGRVLGGMTVPDEFVRHKILDMVGDFALAGAPLLGKIYVGSPSHETNHAFIQALLAQPEAWEWAEFAPLKVEKK